MNKYHTSVLLQETIEYLHIRKGKKYIDATLGGGGHTKEILDRGGDVLGIDVDKDSLAYVKENLKSQISNLKLILVQGNFGKIYEIAKVNGFERVGGILFDLGVSSHQLEEQDRGFSFLRDAPLDMRMSQELHVTASDLINGLTRDELTQLFTKYGEEENAWAIARAIIKERENGPITTTRQLARMIEKRGHRGHIHPATKVFQALRMAVNDELNVLKEALPQAVKLLEAHGRIVVISFHSLEDRIVKQSFLEFEKEKLGRVITEKPISASEEELANNSRARSAKLRVFERN